MNKCCESFIKVCFCNYLDMDRLNYNFCPECGEQMRQKIEVNGEEVKRILYEKPIIKDIFIQQRATVGKKQE